MAISPLRIGDHSETLCLQYPAQMFAAYLARVLRTIATAYTLAPAIGNWKMRQLKEFIENNLEQNVSLPPSRTILAVENVALELSQAHGVVGDDLEFDKNFLFIILSR